MAVALSELGKKAKARLAAKAIIVTAGTELAVGETQVKTADLDDGQYDNLLDRDSMGIPDEGRRWRRMRSKRGANKPLYKETRRGRGRFVSRCVLP